jgi:hypothetical protein
MSDKPDPKDMVLTPGGMRHKAHVHKIPIGHHLDQRSNRIVQRDEQGKVVADHGEIKHRPEDKPLMPGNVTLPPDSVAPLASGWITFADWNNNSGQPASLFVATWHVPPAPTTASGQTIFLFNGIQNSTMIYQPVLQWGPSFAGGGNYWTVASWYADGQGGPVFHSPLTTVNVGQKLIGVMASTGQNGALFSYQCQFIGIPNSILPIFNVPELKWHVITLETYNCTKPTDYPNVPDTPFTGVLVQTGTGTPPPNVVWQPVNAITDTGQHTIVVNNAYGDGLVIIFYVEQ